ncbi:hypothetical protein [Candidatus Soleaferrea massiliensis]|uniref:hypothetical protein n=1 Tax=Candidatus Soleaferrea massiliensis TaxID=1470354 RepID=UPI00058FE6BD|nr:hypothetical protein [Candidatus Soleaferrea massiliensis]
MWSKQAPLLSVRVSHHGKRPRLRLCLAIFLPVLHWLLLCYEDLLALLPGTAGRTSRGAVDAAHGMILGIIASKPQEFVRVEHEKDAEKLRVSVRTIGWGRGKNRDKTGL